MSKEVDRAQLRAKPLDEDCRRARTTRHEYGPDDNRVFCHGLEWQPGSYEERCAACPAFVWNAAPPEGWPEFKARREAELGGMTVRQLRDLARETGACLGYASRKDDIVREIVGHEWHAMHAGRDAS